MKMLIRSIKNEIIKKNNTSLKNSVMKSGLFGAIILFALITAAAVFADYLIVFFNSTSERKDILFDLLSTCFVYFGMFAVPAYLFVKSGYDHAYLEAKDFRESERVVFKWRHTLFWIVPMVAAIILNIVYCMILKYPARPWHYIICFILFTYMRCAVEEYAYRGILAEAMIVKHRETREGIAVATFITSLIGGVTTALVFNFKYNIHMDILHVLALVCFEAVITIIYYASANITMSLRCRFLMKLAILIPCGFFAQGGVVYNQELSLVLALVTGTLASILIMLPIGKKITVLQSKRVDRFYAEYGIVYKKKENPYEKSRFKIHMDKFKNGSSNGLVIAKYVSAALFIGLVSMLAYNMIWIDNNYSYIIPFVRESGLEIMVAQLSTTFLIVSFLSFLTSQDDYILWIDTMSYKLIYPEYINFISLSVCAFSAMVLSAVFYFVKWDLLMLVFSILGFGILTFLTFKMILIFFNRNGLIAELEIKYCQANPEEKIQKISDLYKNTCRVIANNDCQRIQENFNFLAKLYFIYNRQALCMNSKYRISIWEAMSLNGFCLVPNEYKHFMYTEQSKILYLSEYAEDMRAEGSVETANLHNDTEAKIILEYRNKERQFMEIHSRVKDELIYFVATLISTNPMLMVRLLEGYNSKLLEIRTIREEITKYVVSCLDNSVNRSAVYIIFRGVLKSYAANLKDTVEELPLMCNIEERKTIDKFPESDFLRSIQREYAKIREKYPQKYEKFYDSIIEACDEEYKEALNFADSLEFILKYDDKLLSGLYMDWKTTLEREYNIFVNKVAHDREVQR